MRGMAEAALAAGLLPLLLAAPPARAQDLGIPPEPRPQAEGALVPPLDDTRPPTGAARDEAGEELPPAKPSPPQPEGGLIPPSVPADPAQAEPELPPAKPPGPEPQGALIPPTEAARPAGPPQSGSEATESPPQQPPSPPQAQGTLLPPETPSDSTTDATPSPLPGDARPVAPESGPPVHSRLRESDFEFSACRLALHMLGATVEERPPVTGDDPDCGIDRPLAIRAILPGVELAGAPVMRCDLARSLGLWMRDFVQPAARRLPGAPRVVALEPGTTYECRPRVGNDEARLSEHAFGNAYDIAAFRLDDGSRIAVGPQAEGSLEAAFLAAVRWSACLDFGTVLGPGSNAAHENHLHLDVKRRSGGYRVCE